ncbi:MAG: chromophore lyase CpcT/CpeT [Planctomycetes bacterium]|nr:chromophore lyase CpcT/CpeT [Planctomycetota bacterium]
MLLLRSIVLPGLGVVGLACATTSPRRSVELARLATWMTGTFSSANQHRARPDDHLDIRLVAVPIWTERADAPWLYVEQAVAAQPEKPYRQRVYHLVRLADGTYRSDVFTLPGDPSSFVGAWREKEPWSALTPDALAPRTGCSITLRATDAHTFLGSTHERDCPSDHQGAAYATSEVAITEYGLTSWDRGFDAEGKQAWGADKGPYCFDKVAQDPPR